MMKNEMMTISVSTTFSEVTGIAIADKNEDGKEYLYCCFVSSFFYFHLYFCVCNLLCATNDIMYSTNIDRVIQYQIPLIRSMLKLVMQLNKLLQI